MSAENTNELIKALISELKETREEVAALRNEIWEMRKKPVNATIIPFKADRSEVVPVKSENPDLYISVDEICEEFGARAFNCAMRAGFRYLKDFTMVSENDVRNVRNVGDQVIRQVKSVLSSRGLHFSDTSYGDTYEESLPQKGDKVVLLTDVGYYENNRMNTYRKGTILTVESSYRYDADNRFSLPVFQCKGTGEETVSCSVGIVKKL